jgi:arylsulfatase A-like enzyme
LYDELIHVPLVMKLPHSTRTGSIDETVSTEAILPTVLRLTGIHYQDECLRKSLLDFDTPETRPLLAKTILYYDPKVSVRWNEYQYILDETTGSEELYNYKSDPTEHSPISDRSLLNDARNVLRSERARTAAEQKLHQIKPEREELSEETKQRLKTLGYVQ